MRGDGVEELRTALQDLGLESRGNRAALEKRLRKSTKEKTETISQDNGAVTATQGRTETREGDDTTSKTTDLLFVALDVEATCEKDSDFDYDNELLEFPAVLLDAEGRRLAEFHSYVRPSNRPMLSTFCKELTGIRQEDIDVAPLFPEVLSTFESWLSQYSPRPFTNVHFATDGPWDLRDFIRKQCLASQIPRPRYLSHWIDLRKCFVEYYSAGRCSLVDMLLHLGMEFEGRLHCGRDDTENVARLWQRMISDGHTVKLQERLVRRTIDVHRKRKGRRKR